MWYHTSCSRAQGTLPATIHKFERRPLTDDLWRWTRRITCTCKPAIPDSNGLAHWADAMANQITRHMDLVSVGAALSRVLCVLVLYNNNVHCHSIIEHRKPGGSGRIRAGLMDAWIHVHMHLWHKCYTQLCTRALFNYAHCCCTCVCWLRHTVQNLFTTHG